MHPISQIKPVEFVCEKNSDRIVYKRKQALLDRVSAVMQECFPQEYFKFSFQAYPLPLRIQLLNPEQLHTQDLNILNTALQGLDPEGESPQFIEEQGSFLLLLPRVTTGGFSNTPVWESIGFGKNSNITPSHSQETIALEQERALRRVEQDCAFVREQILWMLNIAIPMVWQNLEGVQGSDYTEQHRERIKVILSTFWDLVFRDSNFPNFLQAAYLAWPNKTVSS